jgi:ribosomal protein S8
MSQDIVADALNQIMNAKRARKEETVIERHSKLLINTLELMKKLGYIEYQIENRKVIISLKEINECKSIKPRFNVSVSEIDRYVRRFLPARNFGHVIISTNKGLMTHEKAIENKIGGSLIAYIF